MLWFLLWTVLVLGALAGAFFLARHLYRAGKRLVAELDRAGDLVAAAEDRAQTRLATTQPAPVERVDPEPARLRMAAARERRLARRRRRLERHARAYDRWQSFAR